MIATRFRAVGFAAGIAAAALSCYLVSLQVASERAQLMKVERRILSARADIRQLRTELDTRSRLVQLERWNTDVLGLRAPEVTQYAAGAVELASYAAPRAPAEVIQAVAPAPRPAAPVVTQVALKAPTPRVAAPNPVALPTATLRQATYERPAAQPLLHKASLAIPVGTPPPASAPRPAARAAAAAPLLGDDLLGDIGRTAAREAGRKAH